jgi:nitrate/nitrite transporter NarK
LLWLFARFGGAFSPLLFGALLVAFNSAAFQGLLSSIGLPSAVPGWRVGFWVAGLAGVVWCLAFIPWFRNDPAEMRSVNGGELRLIRNGRSPEPQSHGMPRDLWRSLLSCRSLWALGLLYFCGSFAWSFFVSWLPRYLKEVQGVEFEKSEIISGLPLFCGGITCLVGGIVCDALVRRTGRKRLSRAVLPMCGYVTAAVAIWSVRFADTATEATVLMCLAAGAYDFGQGANWATIVDIGGRYAGIATGLVNLIGNMGNAFSPYVAPKVFNAVGGWDALLACYALAYLAAASMWLFIDPTRTFYRESQAPA